MSSKINDLDKLDKNLKDLDKEGFGQEELGIWIGYKLGYDSPVSQPTISRHLKNRSEKLTYLLDHTTSLLNDLSKSPGKREWDLLQKDKKNGELITWPAVVDRFVTKEIQKFIANKSETELLKIEAVGMKLNSLLTVCQSFLQKEKFPECDIRCVVIDPKESGMYYRGIIEGERGDYDFKVKGGIYSWKDFINELDVKGILADSEVNLRLLKPDPNFYMIRIFNKMLISVYLRDIGNTNHYEILDMEEDSKQFTDYYNLYLEYYNNDKLSSTLDWENLILE